MATIITINSVKQFYDGAANDAVICALIAFVDQADECLDSSGIPDSTQFLLKNYAVAHMLYMQEGGGVKSETDMDGESVTYAQDFSKEGLQATPFGKLIASMPGYSCIANLIDKPRRSFKVVNYC